MKNWDFIVIGGGAAGCVLANRLSASGRHRVLLLEAGANDWNPYIHIPGLSIQAFKSSSIMWDYESEPDKSVAGRRSLWMAGRVLGGGSSVNGTVWVRGHPADFERWKDLGCDGWGWDGVVEYFRRAERFEGKGPLRGNSGPMRVSMNPADHVMTDAFVSAARAGGHAYTPDYNGLSQEGVGYGQTNNFRGFRRSTARAYLGLSVRRRKNLRVETGAMVRRIIFEGKVATGVEYTKRSRTSTAFCNKEIVLSAGAIASPKILLLSGIGPRDDLDEIGIPLIADVPGVGKNLQEHPVVVMLWNVDVRTFNMEFNVAGFMKYGLQFALKGRGPAAAGFFHAILFAKLSPESRWTEIEGAFAPFGAVGSGATNDTSDSEQVFQPGEHNAANMQLLQRPTVEVYLSLLHPSTRGSIGLSSANYLDAPIIRHEMLEQKSDVESLIKGCREMRRIFEYRPLGSHVVGEALPGAKVESDQEWENYLRSGGVWGASHPVGTCKMGIDASSVVDQTLRVRGVDGLRIADASIMPEITSGNTNSPTIMIGEKAADLISQDWDGPGTRDG
jgi:choline dehydrogenase